MTVGKSQLLFKSAANIGCPYKYQKKVLKCLYAIKITIITTDNVLKSKY